MSCSHTFFSSMCFHQTPHLTSVSSCPPPLCPYRHLLSYTTLHLTSSYYISCFHAFSSATSKSYSSIMYERTSPTVLNIYKWPMQPLLPYWRRVEDCVDFVPVRYWDPKSMAGKEFRVESMAEEIRGRTSFK